ncbi:heptaprenyl diphosphate synthase component 1 [Virgibacillus indicus]|nr:heptaprenyl diphosphate synthase component 1 [Virgibacillus indicus]
MNTSSMDIRHLKALIEDKIQHAYLEKYIQQPVIDEDKLFLLTAVLNNTELSSPQKERYILTTMLVQIALDTHDLVPKTNVSGESDEARLTKQLSVLAGDYYSGLYYLLLSEIEDFDLIHKLAAAIKEINENKMKLYYKEVNSFQEYIDILKEIESLLIIYLADYVEEYSLNNITGDWLIMNKLIREKESLEQNGYSKLLDSWFSSNFNSSNTAVSNTIDTMIQKYKVSIEKSLLKLSMQHRPLKNYIMSQLSEPVYNNASIAEEG